MAVCVLLALLLWQGPTPEQERAEELHNQGAKLIEQGKAEEAREAINASLALHTKLGKIDAQAINLRLLAFLHDGTGERQKALGYYERALRLVQGGKYLDLEARTLRDVGVLYYNLDENAKAFAYFERALAIQRKTAKPGALAVTLFSQGELRRYLGEKVKARALYAEALELARQSGERQCEADVLSSLGILDLSGEQLDAALLIRRETKDPRGEASTRVKRGAYFAAKNEPTKAREETREAVRLFVEAKYRGGEAFARQSLAMLERKAGNPEAAAAEMLAAIEIAESLRQRLSDRDLRATYIGYVQNRYEFLMETFLLLDKGDARRALAISERARARALVEALGEAGVKTAEGPVPLTAEQIQTRVLDADTTLVEYALGAAKSHLFVVTQGAVVYRELPGRAVLEAKVRAAYEAYRQPEGVPDTAGLAKLLLPGVKAKRLLVVADGALQYLPFAALTEAETVVIAPSASAVAAMRALPQRKAAAKQLAVFADPAVPELARLAFSRQEAQSILRLVPEAGRFAALGADATRAAVLTNSAEIVHIAAHSVLDTDRPERTEIRLAGGSLRVRDVYAMRLEADLVVLSACQTALGKEMMREGLMSLTRAFQQAGAPRVVASLWKVDDRATAELMKHFYEGMLQRREPAALALRGAQRKLAATVRWRHPFYWAGFVFQGEWR